MVAVAAPEREPIGHTGRVSDAVVSAWGGGGREDWAGSES